MPPNWAAIPLQKTDTAFTNAQLRDYKKLIGYLTSRLEGTQHTFDNTAVNPPPGQASDGSRNWKEVISSVGVDPKYNLVLKMRIKDYKDGDPKELDFGGDDKEILVPLRNRADLLSGKIVKYDKVNKVWLMVIPIEKQDKSLTVEFEVSFIQK